MTTDSGKSAAIAVRGLCFRYGAYPVLRSVDADIGTGRLTAILGRNGSGKSTLLRILAGLLDYPKGSVNVLGRELRGYTADDRARLVGLLPQQHRAVFPFTVADVVLTGRVSHIRFMPRRCDVDCAEEAMRQVGILDLRDRAYTELSGGEQQMVLIARVLAQRPRIVLLDEPTSHLDLHNQAALMTLARTLVATGMTVICVLHDPNLAFAYADDLIFLRNGQVVSPKTGAAPWAPDFLNAVYGTEIHAVVVGDRALVVPVSSRWMRREP